MITRFLIPGTLACLAATAATAVAQEGRGGYQDDREAQPLTKQTHGKTAFVCKADKIVGAEVKDAQGEEIGTVDELILSPSSSEVAYVTIKSGGILGLGADTHVVPWSKLRMEGYGDDSMRRPGVDGGARGAGDTEDQKRDSDKDKDEICFILDVPSDKFSNAPALPEDSRIDAAWEMRIRTHYGMGQDPTGRSAEQLPMARVLITSSDLKDAKIESVRGDQFGHVEDIIIDPKEGRVAYVVLEVDELKTLKDKQFAVPLEVFQVSRGTEPDSDLRISAAGLDENRLSRAPAFDSGAWDKMSNPIWVREVYTYWNLDPYWSQTVEAGYRKPLDEPGSDTEKEMRERREKERGSGDGGQR